MPTYSTEEHTTEYNQLFMLSYIHIFIFFENETLSMFTLFDIESIYFWWIFLCISTVLFQKFEQNKYSHQDHPTGLDPKSDTIQNSQVRTCNAEI
jgi:hypothetical protein